MGSFFLRSAPSTAGRNRMASVSLSRRYRNDGVFGEARELEEGNVTVTLLQKARGGITIRATAWEANTDRVRKADGRRARKPSEAAAASSRPRRR